MSERDGYQTGVPYDIPVAAMRQAVLADPQGAAFSVTEVGPPA